MKLYEKKKTVELLDKLRVMNYKSAFIYKILYQKENRLIIKDFYRKLYDQKIKFITNIEKLIDQLKKEISPLKDPEILSFYKRRKCELSQLYLKYKMSLKYEDVYKRELKSYKKYYRYLSKTNHGCSREIILEHKHKIKCNISEMNNMDLVKYSFQ